MKKKKKCSSCHADLDMARLRRDIIRMHERENDELMCYIKSLEQAIEQASEETPPHRIRCEYYDSDDGGGSVILNIDVDDDDKSQSQLRKEQKRRKQLLLRIQALEDEVRLKEEAIRKREDEKKRLEEENECLHKKATIDIMLDDTKPAAKGANHIMRMARKVQIQLEDRNACGVDLDRLEKDVEKLVEYANSRPELELDVEKEEQEEPVQQRRVPCKERPGTPSTHIKASRSTGMRPRCSKFIPSCLSGDSRGISPVCTSRGRSPESKPSSRPVSRSRGRSAPPLAEVDMDTVRVEVGPPRSHSRDERKGGKRKLWTEVKVRTKTPEEQELEEALEHIQSSLAHLLAVDRRKKWQEAQVRHLGYYPQEKLPRSALWDPPNLL